MAQSALKQAIEEICTEKNIPYQSVIETIEAALAVAYRKDFGQPNENIVATFDVETGNSRVFDVKTVVADDLFTEYQAEQKRREEAEVAEKLDEYLAAKREEDEKIRTAQAEAIQNGEAVPEESERFDPKKHIALSEAQKLDKKYELGSEIRRHRHRCPSTKP